MEMTKGAAKRLDVSVAITAASAVAAAVVLFFFVQTLRASIDRGAALRATWQNEWLVQNKRTTPLMDVLTSAR